MELQTQIGAVTVYSDRALVSRTGTAHLQSGAQEIIIAGLPAQLQTDSLRASGRGTVAVKIIGVEARERTLTKPNSPTAREIQSQFETAQDAGSAIVDAMARLDQRMVTVNELARESARRFAKTLAQGTSEIENATQLLDYVAAQLQQIDEQRAELETRKRDNAAIQMSLADRLKQLNTGKAKSENIVAVLVESAGEGEWQLELSYLVGNARWTPLYDARVSTGENAKFILSLNALVVQKSGENWTDVALKLSTARPGLGSLPPRLNPVWVDEPRLVLDTASMAMPRVAGGWSENDDNIDDMLESLKPTQKLENLDPMRSRKSSIEAEDVVADVESSSHGGAVEFNLPHSLSVPGDGQSHRVAIAVREFPTQFDYLAIPRRIEIAYLRAKATNNSELALLTGQVSIFRDSVFVGKAQLKNTASGGELELFLGPDEQIRARREMTTRETDKNLLGNVKRVHFAYEIELNNLKKQAVTLDVQDQIPVSRSENIKIKLRGATPEATQSDLGVLEWRVNLKAGEKKTLRFDYVVETPRDTRVVGLVD